VGRNVAAGMTGGLAYILDEDDTLIPKVYTRILFTILFTNGREIFYFHYA
jgi:glutamate synthase domain-containing protein 3